MKFYAQCFHWTWIGETYLIRKKNVKRIVLPSFVDWFGRSRWLGQQWKPEIDRLPNRYNLREEFRSFRKGESISGKSGWLRTSETILPEGEEKSFLVRCFGQFEAIDNHPLSASEDLFHSSASTLIVRFFAVLSLSLRPRKRRDELFAVACKLRWGSFRRCFEQRITRVSGLFELFLSDSFESETMLSVRVLNLSFFYTSSFDLSNFPTKIHDD